MHGMFCIKCKCMYVCLYMFSIVSMFSIVPYDCTHIVNIRVTTIRDEVIIGMRILFLVLVTHAFNIYNCCILLKYKRTVTPNNML